MIIRREAVAGGGTPLANPGKARVMLRILEFYCPRRLAAREAVATGDTPAFGGTLL